MGLAAVLVAIITVLFGTVALGDVATPSASGDVKMRVAGHLLLAGTGLVLLLVAVVAASGRLAWVSLIVLLGAASLGLATLVRAARRADEAAATTDPDRPAPAGAPRTVVVLHGGAAGLTILLVLLAAVRMG
jgi:hypothetical protein